MQYLITINRTHSHDLFICLKASALDFMEVEDVVHLQKAETVYRELPIRHIINAVKVCTEEYKEQHKLWE